MSLIFHNFAENFLIFHKLIMTDKSSSFLKKNGVNFIIPFILITLCFALWGFANDITNPMVKAFSKIFRMSATDGALVQLAFYGGYFAMALPAAMFITRYSYKTGVLLGLTLYAAGSLLFLPARNIGEYLPFLFAYFIMTCGLSFLETSCNPYILSMGSEDTAARRLNLAQCFNPVGSLLGMFVAMNFIQARLDPTDTAGRALLDNEAFETMKAHDLAVLVAPYLALGLALIGILVAIRLVPMPKTGDCANRLRVKDAFSYLWNVKRYRQGVIAQFFYVGAQITCWTFIIQYATRIFMAEGMDEQAAEILSQKYNIAAMALFCCSRFVCTYLLRYIKPQLFLKVMAIAGGMLTCGVICFQNLYGLYCLVGVSACMSLMFPTIYSIALRGLGEYTKFGAAGLIMSILGGSVLPPVQAAIIDLKTVFDIPAEGISFVIPLICFLVIAWYGKVSVSKK